MQKEEILGLTSKLYKLTLLFPKKEPLRYKLRETGANLLANIIGLTTGPTRFATRNGQEGDFSDSSKELISGFEQEFEILKSFFQIAKDQDWVKREALLDLEKEYESIAKQVRETISQPRVVEEVVEPVSALTEEEQLAEIPEQKEIPKPKKEAAKPVVSLPPIGLDKQEPGIRKQEPGIELDKRQKKVLKVLQEKKEVQIGQLSKKFPQVSRRTLLRDLEKLSQLGFVNRQGDGRGVYYRFQLGKSPTKEKKPVSPYEKYQT